MTAESRGVLKQVWTQPDHRAVLSHLLSLPALPFSHSWGLFLPEGGSSIASVQLHPSPSSGLPEDGGGGNSHVSHSEDALLLSWFLLLLPLQLRLLSAAGSTPQSRSVPCEAEASGAWSVQ